MQPVMSRLTLILAMAAAAAVVVAQDAPRKLSFYDDLRASPSDPLSHDVFNVTLSDGSKNQQYHLRHLSALIAISADSDGYDWAAAAFLALNHFNNGVSIVVPEIAEVTQDCNIKFTMEMMDTHFSPIKAATDLIQTILPRKNIDPPDPMLPYPTALLGAVRSAVSAPLASFAGVQGLTQISHASTSTSLDNPTQYPTFGRLIPAAVGDANAAVDYLSINQVTHLAVLFVKDPYGSTYAQAIKQLAEQATIPMEVTLFPFEFDASNEDIAYQIQQIRRSDVRYIVGVFFESSFDVVMSEAYRQGIAGPGYFWLFGDALSGAATWQYDPNTQANIISGFTGSALLLTAHPETRLWRNQTGEFMKEWNELLNSTEWEEYLSAKIPAESIITSFGSEDKFTIRDALTPTPNSFTLLCYDAVVAIALASCAAERSSGNPLFSSTEVYEEFKRIKFDGAYSPVAFDTKTGSRDFRTVPYSITNLVALEPSTDSGLVSFSAISTHTYDRMAAEPGESGIAGGDAPQWQEVEGTAFVYADGTTTPPPALPPNEEKIISLSQGARVYGLFLCALALALSTLFYIWVVLRRKTVVVRASQPLFLGLLCFGTFIMASAIIPMGIEDSNAACQAIPWLFTTGFNVVFSALFTKLSRVNKVYFRRDCHRVVVGAKDVMKPFLVLLTLNLIVLISWTVVAPLTSKYVETGAVDRFGRSTSSFHTCFPQNASAEDITFLSLILSINLVSLLYANVEAYKGRSIQTQYNESKFIGLTMLILLQAFIIGVPIFFVVYEEPTARYVVMSSLSFVLCIAVLLPLFLPKVHFLREHEERLERIAVKKKIERKKRWALEGLAYGDWQSEASAGARQVTISQREPAEASPGLEILRNLDEEQEHRENDREDD